MKKTSVLMCIFFICILFMYSFFHVDTIRLAMEPLNYTWQNTTLYSGQQKDNMRTKEENRVNEQTLFRAIVAENLILKNINTMDSNGNPLICSQYVASVYYAFHPSDDFG